ncbi:hypothetical protein CN141_34370 [Sinorhizobium meliloti]|nr:hypothetical protein CN141_34370 [Sinorhizobium meliloti]
MDHRIIAAGAALSIVAVVLAWIYRQGGDDVRQSIRQNNEAGRTADDGNRPIGTACRIAP